MEQDPSRKPTVYPQKTNENLSEVTAIAVLQEVFRIIFLMNRFVKAGLF